MGKTNRKANVLSSSLSFALKIAGTQTRVDYGPDIPKQDKEDIEGEYECTGHWHETTSSIEINSKTSPATQVSSLIHELIEAFNGLYGMDMKHRQIVALEAAIYAFLIDQKIITPKTTFSQFVNFLTSKTKN